MAQNKRQYLCMRFYMCINVSKKDQKAIHKNAER